MQPAIEHGAGAAPDFPDEILDAAKMPHPITTSTAFDTGDPAMNIMFDRLFANYDLCHSFLNPTGLSL